MKSWIKCPTFMNADLLGVYEVKCPVCGFKETYIGNKNAPTRCYICNERLSIEKENRP